MPHDGNIRLNGLSRRRKRLVEALRNEAYGSVERSDALLECLRDEGLGDNALTREGFLDAPGLFRPAFYKQLLLGPHEGLARMLCAGLAYGIDDSDTGPRAYDLVLRDVCDSWLSAMRKDLEVRCDEMAPERVVALLHGFDEVSRITMPALQDAVANGGLPRKRRRDRSLDLDAPLLAQP